MNNIYHLLSIPQDYLSPFFEPPKENLESAIRAGNVEKVEEFLKTGHGINQPMVNGHLPLHAAIRAGQHAVVQLLVQKGADLTKCDLEGFSAFDYASLHPNKDVVLALLSFSTPQKRSWFENLIGKTEKFQFGDPAAVAATAQEINEYKNFLTAQPLLDESAVAIMSQDPKLVEALLKKGPAVKERDLALAIVLKNEQLVKSLLAVFPGDINKELQGQSFSLVHLAAAAGHPAILKALALKQGDLKNRNKTGVSPADLIFAKNPPKEPLQISKAKTILTLLGLSVIFYENMVEPVLSPQSAAFLKGALFLINLSSGVAVNYQLYTQLNPETLFEKAYFWGSNLATIPFHMGLAQILPVKICWDLWRCYHVSTTAFHELKRSYYHYPYAKEQALKHASLQIMTVGSTYYHCRETARMLTNFAGSLFDSTTPPPKPTRRPNGYDDYVDEMEEEPIRHDDFPSKSTKTNTQFCCREKNRFGECKTFQDLVLSKTSNMEIRGAIKNLEYRANDLKARVQTALENGGKIERGISTNGLYHILDSDGNTVGLFRPENERNFGPEGLLNKKVDPTLEDIHFHKMDSFEQGMLTQKQYYSKLLDQGERANLPLGTIVEMESDAFNNEGLTGLNRCKIGYLQEFIPDGEKPTRAQLDTAHLNDFQKIGIMDVQTYNQDRHIENLLLKPNGRLINIDSDAILPFKLENNPNVILQSKRASEPFTEESLRLIEQIDPRFNADLARALGLPEQSAINAEILAHTLKKYASKGLTLADLYQHIGSDNRDKPSELWTKMEKASQTARQSLSTEELDALKYYEHLRWVKWWDKKSENEDWWKYYTNGLSQRINGHLKTAFWSTFNHPSKRKIAFGTTYVPGNPLRDEMSALVNGNHKEYADKWGLEHRTVAKNLLENQCTVDGYPRTCSPYWNKIKVVLDWFQTKSKNPEPDAEEWYVMADDDMVVTNMNIDPNKAIDDLRRGSDGIVRDTSFIIAQDVMNYSGNRQASVNTGLFFVRKDEQGAELIQDIWRRRNHIVPWGPSYCPTYGVCEKQATLHEQDALCNIIKERGRSLVDRVLTIVPPRDTSSPTRGHIAMNTFERSGSFVNTLWGSDDCTDYNDPEEGQWRKGDWMGQTAGVPVEGRNCGESKVRRLRQEKIEGMLSQVEGKPSSRGSILASLFG
ncbi:MAG: ankyrin repeat domain-containing protein [Verrucomicrobia bacterium]|nr:ankyrin repeat domain-containing protein [Verrucomicrobiota bacterium]